MEKYIVKHVCCRLAESGMKIPAEIVSYLGDETAASAPYLHIELEIRADIVEYIDRLSRQAETHGSLWVGELIMNYSNSRRQITNAYSFFGYRWLRINYFFDIDNLRGSSNFSTDHVSLPVGRNVATADIDALTDEGYGDPEAAT
ncbi:hypothetical protein LWC34_40415 [Kibdelosporangium philippinense]|uniref:Uncharacterized protein n=1 Tax=Kibdelosporangium philippinense TaxID=211113 RepID=A0ABS8ZMU9_9PSEU|nr:hypothetical protein [Kibdelosporangium philippinense]